MHRRPRATALALSVLVLAGIGGSPSAALAGIDEHLIVVSTDFAASGSASTVGLCPPFPTQIDVETVGADPVVRYWHDRIYVVNRFGNDAIQVIDPETHDTVLEFSVGPLSNPQDIAVVDETTAFVSRFGSRWLHVVDPSSGAVTDSIDLGSFADADGRPEMAYMTLAGDRLFVQLQRLDTDGFFDPVPPSYLAVVDVPTRALIDVDPGAPGTQAITLASTNPQQKMHLDTAGGRLYVSEIGRFGELDGGVEVIDVDTFASLGFALDESVVGGDVSTTVIVSPALGYALTSSDFFFTTSLTRFDPTTGAVTGTLYTTPAFTSGLVLDASTGKLYLADRRTTAPGIRVFDTATNTQLSTGAISVGLPPVDMAVVRAPVVSVADTGIPPRPETHAVPSPFSETTALRLPDIEARGGRIEIFGTGGRRIRSLDVEVTRGGTRAVWDGRDRRGARAAPGVYMYRLRRSDGTGDAAVGRVILVR